MLSEESKARIWMWWPYAAFLLLTALLVGGFFYFMPSGASQLTEGEKAAQIQQLTKPEVFLRAFISANGGEAKLEALKSIRTTGTFESGGQTVPFRTIKRRPDKSITTLQMPDYKLSFVVNGATAWQRVEQPMQDPVDTLKQGEEASALRDLGHFFGPLMHVVLNEPEGIVAIEEASWESEPVLRMEFESKRRKMHATVLIDLQNMAPILRREESADGVTREVFYRDYRQIDGGILEPFSVETYVNGELQSRVLIENCETNVGAPGFLFEYTGEAGGDAP